MTTKTMANKSLKIVIVGATSGLGEALAIHYLRQGHSVGITGRRLNKLTSLQQRFLGRVFIKQMDVTLAGQAVIQLNHLIDKMEGVDLIVLNAGIGSINHELDWKIEQQTIDTNISGFTALAMTAT
ncbi:MAG: SDR family NAD(P)-dependent oxidoreductase, partial [Kangiellaceae bacterium]|nr:SDR family NAD(P)-dependent oxidoreductase [Kangiellaceae bacterium]